MQMSKYMYKKPRHLFINIINLFIYYIYIIYVFICICMYLLSIILSHFLKIKSYIKDTNNFLCNLVSLPLLPDDVILCTTDVVGLHPITLHDK